MNLEQNERFLQNSRRNQFTFTLVQEINSSMQMK
jgi:hypothetical protein